MLWRHHTRPSINLHHHSTLHNVTRNYVFLHTTQMFAQKLLILLGSTPLFGWLLLKSGGWKKIVKLSTVSRYSSLHPVNVTWWIIFIEYEYPHCKFHLPMIDTSSGPQLLPAACGPMLEGTLCTLSHPRQLCRDGPHCWIFFILPFYACHGHFLLL